MTTEGYYPLPARFRRTQCRSCGQSITWVQTATGARMPLDLAETKQIDGQLHALTHFATCPHRKAWHGLSKKGQKLYAATYAKQEGKADMDLCPCCQDADVIVGTLCSSCTSILAADGFTIADWFAGKVKQ